MFNAVGAWRLGLCYQQLVGVAVAQFRCADGMVRLSLYNSVVAFVCKIIRYMAIFFSNILKAGQQNLVFIPKTPKIYYPVNVGCIEMVALWLFINNLCVDHPSIASGKKKMGYGWLFKR